MNKRLAALKPILYGFCLVVATCAVLYPFATKAFHIDDPLFLWVAERILEAPFDFFGSSVNWEHFLTPMPEVMKNPPLASYYIALVSVITGDGPFDEETLHIFFMIPSAATIVGTYLLARRFTQSPVLAALATLATPAFLVSSTTLLCDVTMLAFWVWAIVFWMEGSEKGSGLCLFIAAVLVALSALTKYFGMNLILLLAAYSIFARHPVRRWAPFLLIPIALLACYQWATQAMYGTGLLTDAASYASNFRVKRETNYAERAVTAMIFTGGITMLALFFAPLIWGWRRAVAGCVILTAAFGAILFYRSRMPDVYYFAQAGLMATAGLILLWLTITEIYKRRDAQTLLLVLWIWGTFLFTAFINWGIAARFLLPLAPPTAILIVRAASDRKGAPFPATWLPLLPALALSLAVAWADFTLAESSRRAAFDIAEKYSRPASGQTLWFQGHWGFQYYMEELGAKALDMKKSEIKEGDMMAVPLNNSFTTLDMGPSMEFLHEYKTGRLGWLSTMSNADRAGFYSSGRGPMPYVFGKADEERYYIFRAARNFSPK